MAYAIRIDNIQVVSGMITVNYTAGQTPLAGTWQGQAWTFDKTMIQSFIPQFEAEIQDVLFLYILHQWHRISGTLSPAVLIGKTVTLDLNSLTNSLSVA